VEEKNNNLAGVAAISTAKTETEENNKTTGKQMTMEF